MNVHNVKMFASFERNIFIPLDGKADDAEMVYNKLRNAGARMAKHNIQSLIDGNMDALRDFEVVTVVGGQKAAEINNQPRRTRSYEPSVSPVRPIKRGAIYTKLMEMMVKGATMGEMLAITNNETEGGVNAVISHQVRQRGYGINFDKETGKYHLIFPKGQKELLYKD